MHGFGEPGDRLVAFGTALVEIHDRLRAELAELRADLGGSGGRARELSTHCLAFCTALDRHHTGEDAGAFPLLARRFPQLRPTIDKLVQDHRLVADIVRRIEQVVADLPAEPDAAQTRRVSGELDGLAAILESHFSYEERTIVAALDTMTSADGTAEDLFGLDAPGDG